jgi:hypothetical protein
MCWENLTVESGEPGEPGEHGQAAETALFGADAATRCAPAPVLNRVPGASRMPFEWTVNPYRGRTWGLRSRRLLSRDGQSVPGPHPRVRVLPLTTRMRSGRPDAERP